MNKLLTKQLSLMALWLLAPGLLLAGGARTNAPFEAIYEVTIDGKPRIETRISLAEDGSQWLFESKSKGTGGLAKLLKADSLERSSGQIDNGKFIPSAYQHRSKLAGKDDHWNASFNWSRLEVITHHEKGESVLPLNAGTNDPMSMTLAIRSLLAQGLKDIELEVVNEDEIKQYVYQAAESEILHTPLGCFDAIPLTRIREEESKRYSTGWYAKSLAYIPVQIRHGKKGGKEFEMRITHLIMDGKPVSGLADCPS